MSGTSYGAWVLHVTPESFIGGPLAMVRDGDLIQLDVPARKLNLLISGEEMARRLRFRLLTGASASAKHKLHRP
jgi:dihydroxyacid dehydratase/phosphogluconate dehydratase